MRTSASRSRPYWIYPLAVGLLFLRRPDQFFHPQFQAEDGGIFFMQARESGALAIPRTYNGYHHLLPRLTAALTDFVAPPRWAPHVYALASVLALLVVVGMASSPRIRLPGKQLVALAPLLIPHNGWTYLHLTDVQFVLAWGLILLVIAEPPARMGERIFDVVYLVVAGMTGPFILFFLPLFVARALIRKDRHGAIMLAIAIMCSGLQARDLPSARVHVPGGQFDVRDPAWVEVIGVRYAGIGILGQDLGSKIAKDRRGAWVLLIVTAALLLTATYLVLFPFCPRLLAIHLAGLAVFLATLWAYRVRPATLTGLVADRYSFFPMTALAVVLVAAWRRGGPRARIAGFLLLAIVPGAAATFRSQELDDDGWKHASTLFGRDLPADIIIHPYWVLRYRPENEGRGRSPHLADDVARRGLGVVPRAITPPLKEPLLTAFRGTTFLRSTPETTIEFEIPRGARGFRVRTALQFRGGTPHILDGFDLLVERADDGGSEFRILRTLRHQPGPEAMRGIFPRPIDLETPLDGEPGRLRLRAAPLDATRGTWWILWGAVVFR